MDIIGVIDTFVTPLLETQYGPLLKLALLTVLIVIYAVFTFYFYRFLAKKNIIELNLSRYNKYGVGFFLKVLPVLLYILEYIIILPILTFFWFTVLSILVFLLAEGLTLEIVILISAALVAAVRVTAYVNENLSQDLAKMLPLTLLGVALTRPTFFDFSSHFTRINEIPTLFTEVIYFLVFIMALEFIMRLFDLIKNIGQEAKAMKEGIDNTKVEVEDD